MALSPYVVENSKFSLEEKNNKEYPKHVTIILSRHGVTLLNQLKLWAGQLNIPLAPEGEEQAKQLGRTLKEYGLTDIDEVYSSTLKRAIDTTRIALKELGYSEEKCNETIIQDQRLCERNMGSATGEAKSNEFKLKIKHPSFNLGQKDKIKITKSLAQHYPETDLFLPNTQLKGETRQEVANRTLSFLNCIKDNLTAGKTILIVGHSNSFKELINILSNVEGYKTQNADPVEIKLACQENNRLAFDKKGMPICLSIKRIAEITHEKEIPNQISNAQAKPLQETIQTIVK